jgi:hypothetical protein
MTKSANLALNSRKPIKKIINCSIILTNSSKKSRLSSGLMAISKKKSTSDESTQTSQYEQKTNHPY